MQNSTERGMFVERSKHFHSSVRSFRGNPSTKQLCEVKIKEEKGGVEEEEEESSARTDTDTNLWARSKTWLHTRGYEGWEVLVSLSHQSCDRALRLWPGQMRGHSPRGSHYLLSVFFPDIYRRAAGPQARAIIWPLYRALLSLACSGDLL